jgi:hypothetical protein
MGIHPEQYDVRVIDTNRDRPTPTRNEWAINRGTDTITQNARSGIGQQRIIELREPYGHGGRETMRSYDVIPIHVFTHRIVMIRTMVERVFLRRERTPRYEHDEDRKTVTRAPQPAKKLSDLQPASSTVPRAMSDGTSSGSAKTGNGTSQALPKEVQAA